MSSTAASPQLKGIIPPVVTPMSPDGVVDVAGLERLVGFLLEAGVHGLFVLGSSGEAPYLSDAQRGVVVQTVLGMASGQVPVLVGVLDMTAPRIAHQATAARDAGADYVVVTPPFYALASHAEVVAHFKIVRERGELPIVAYDIPARSSYKLTPEIVRELAQDQVIAGIKDSSSDVVGLRRMLPVLAENGGLAALVGSELIVDVGVFLGAAGAVPGLANVDPHGYVRLYQAAWDEDWITARAEQHRLLKLYRSIELGRSYGLGIDAAAYGAFKAALAMRGVLTTAHTAAPQHRLPTPVQEEINKLMIEADLL